jgi:3-isopropylmalate dehydratase small subunit
MNFRSLLSCFFVIRKVQLSAVVVYAVLETSYARLFYTKVVDNGVLHLLYKFHNL